jgi:hypothetical protein
LVVFKIQADDRCFRPPFPFSFSRPIPESLLRCLPSMLGPQPLCGDWVKQQMVKQQMVRSTAVDPRGAEWTFFGPGLLCQCHLWENCTLAVRNPARSETRLTTEATLQRPRSKVIIDGGPWNSVLSVSSLCSFARGPKPAGAQPRSELDGGQ